MILTAAVVALASCTSDDYVGREIVDEEDVISTNPIGFSLTVPGQTRAALSGEDAANALNNEFVVFGIKNATTDVAAQNTFTNYVVKYTANSAGTAESNTNNWEYVGETPYSSSLVTPSIWESATTKQTVKYWDYSATNGYTFTAFSGKNFLSTGKVEKKTNGSTKYDNGYTVTVPANSTLKDIYFSDIKDIAKTDYDKPVVLTFRNFGSKIRVGFYETIPGYSVKIDKFYYDADASTTASTAPVTKFANMTDTPSNGEFVAALQNVNPAASSNTVTVTYYADGANVNQPKVSTGSTSTYQYALTLGSGVTSATALGTDPSHATYTDASYSLVYPNLDNTNPMLIRCDYTLTADDGSGETIKVKNARVTVPTQYVQWKSNYAYTYLFKISNNTNGTTGNNPSDLDNPQPSDDAEGLYPITFDAVVMEATDYAQETTTTVATNSVTSYAKDGYSATKDIYFVNTKTTGDHSVNTVAGTTKETANHAVIYSFGNSTAISEGEILAKLTGSKITGLTLTEVTSTSNPSGTVSAAQYVPSADNTNLDFGANGALKFTPSKAGNYAYVYCIKPYVAPTYAEASVFETGKVYYANTNDTTPADGVYFTASGIVDQASFTKYMSTSGRKLYTKTADGTAGQYDVKVITVK